MRLQCKTQHKSGCTFSSLLEAHTHASIGNGNVIIAPVGLLELLHVLQLLGVRQEYLHQDLLWLQVPRLQADKTISSRGGVSQGHKSQRSRSDVLAPSSHPVPCQATRLRQAIGSWQQQPHSKEHPGFQKHVETDRQVPTFDLACIAAITDGGSSQPTRAC